MQQEASGLGAQGKVLKLLVRIGAITLAGALAAIVLCSDTPPSIRAARLDKPPIVDGKLTDGEWSGAETTSAFLDRATAKDPSEQTQVWLGFTKKAIYVAFHCIDREPNRIVAREVIPNSSFKGEDFVEFDINPFGNRTYDQLCEFMVNALGTKSERIQTGRADKREWRGDWKAATSRVADGWVCEIEIPWSMLNYPSKERFNMDLNFIRVQGRNLFEQSWANARQNPLPELQGIWQNVEPPPAAKPKVQFLGYVAPELDHGVFQNRMGLDARYAFTPSVTGAVSIAPDFKNIQNVVPGIDFVRTERFLGEARPFFTEGSGFFNLSGDFAYGTMFYSRRIDDFDAATKFYGQASPTLGFGALYTNKFDGQKSMVFNVNKTLSPTSSLNVFGTSNADGVENNSFGFNYSRRTGKIGLDFGAAMEKDDGTKADTAGTLGLTYQGKEDFAMARYMWVTPQFNPALALIPWTDRRGAYLYYERTHNIRKGPVAQVAFNGSTDEFRTYDGVVQEKGFDSTVNIRLRNDIGFGVAKVHYTYSGVLDDYLLYGLGFNVSNRFKQFAINYQEGTQSGLPSKYYILKGSYRLIKNLDLTLSKSVLELDGTARQTVSTLAYQISPQDLISSRMVMNGDNQNLFFSYRHAGFKGTEYYLIYGDPNAATTSNRLSIKMVWAF